VYILPSRHLLSSIVFNLLPKPKATFYSGFLQVNDILIFISAIPGG
jgi:hypothetical protein